MSRLEYVQALGAALIVIAGAWLAGPWLLLALGVLLLAGPEVLARRDRQEVQ